MPAAASEEAGLADFVTTLAKLTLQNTQMARVLMGISTTTLLVPASQNFVKARKQSGLAYNEAMQSRTKPQVQYNAK